jgi:hypothetical protein
VAVAVGGDGGSGGNGGKVTVENAGVMHTTGPNSDGVFAQSVGGSGGSGGSATSGTLVFPIEIEGVEIPAISATVAVGGGGAGGGTAGTVTVNNSGEITTADFLSNGVFAQSVGGSGGRGGHATNISLAFDATFTGKVAVGGSGGQGGTGNTVTVGNSGSIRTQSAFSNGVFAQSIGGGGGSGGNATNISLSLTPPPTAPGDFIPTPSMDFDLAIGGDGGSGAFGGAVDITNTGSISTEGHFATGVMAQSVGGAGGSGGDARTIQVELTADPLDFVPLTALTSLDLTLVFGGDGGSGSYGGTVTVTNEGDVTTSGAFSHGIVAQSVGGGGGVGGSAMTFEFSNADIVPDVPVLDDISGLTTIEMTLQGSGGGGGDGGTVTLDSRGNVQTRGDFAMGIVAQSVAGGGGLAGLFNPHGIINNEIGDAVFNALVDTDAGLSFAGSVGGAGTAGKVIVKHTGNIQTVGDGAHGLFAQSAAGLGSAGDVDITLDGSINASGDSAHGIYAQSGGGSGNGDITLTIGNGVVSGGTGTGAGIFIAGGSDNELRNRGTIVSVAGIDGRSIVAGGGNERIENHGTITGNVSLGAGANVFINHFGAVFNSGSRIEMGPGSPLDNAGTLSPGGAGNILVTALDGTYSQTSTGTLLIDVDLEHQLTDRLQVSEGAQVAGALSVNAMHSGRARPGRHQRTVLTADGGITDSGLALQAPMSAVVRYETLRLSPNEIAIVSDVDFSPKRGQPLSDNARQVADYVNAIQNAGGTEAFAPIVAALVDVPDGASLNAAYKRLLAESMGSLGNQTVAGSVSFNDAMHSCRQRVGEHRFVREGECTWLRVDGVTRDQDTTSTNPGYQLHAVAIAGGAQQEIVPDTHAGFGLSYQRSRLDSSLSDSEGQHIEGAVIVKRRYAATMLSASVSAGYGSYDTVRTVDLPTPGVRATSDQRIVFAAIHGRVSHDFKQGENLYIRPLVDLGVTTVHRKAFNEAGAGGANLDVASATDTLVTVQPSIEIGGELQHGRNTLVRPYARIGITRYLSDNKNQVTATMQGAPAGVAPFTTSTRADRTYADLSLGIDVLKDKSTVLRVGYAGQFSENSASHGAGAKLSIRF